LWGWHIEQVLHYVVQMTHRACDTGNRWYKERSLFNCVTLFLQINYFGVINQKTGEDWTNARLILSTAQPGVGGTIPELRGQIVKFKPERR